jgi:hypothetical protein
MNEIMAMYAVYLGMGHTLTFKTIKARTVRNYLSEAAKLIQKHREAYVLAHPQASLTWFCPTRTHGSTVLAPPIASCLLEEIERWESMIDRREPLTVDMIHFQKSLCRDSTPHSLDQAMYDWETTGIYAGFRLSEWAQEDHVQRLDQVKLAIDGEPTAFLINDLEFRGENGRHMTRQAALQRPYLVQQVLVRWQFQKNGTKKEQKTFVRITGGDRSLCAVSAWLRIVKRWADLKLGSNHPLAVFSDTGTASGTPDFIRSMHIKATLQQRPKKYTTLRTRGPLTFFCPFHPSGCMRGPACCRRPACLGTTASRPPPFKFGAILGTTPQFCAKTQFCRLPTGSLFPLCPNG